MMRIPFIFILLPLFGLSAFCNLGVAQTTDLALKVDLSKHLGRVGDTILCEIKLNNELASKVSQVLVNVVHSDALRLLDTRTTKGTYDRNTGNWLLEQIQTAEKSMQLTIRYILVQSGPSAVTAEIKQCSEPDFDSTPDNSAIHEDDIAYGTVTVPIVICGNLTIDITAYALPGFSRYQWKKDEVVIPGESGQSLRITEPGNYSYLVLDNDKVSTFSAPIIVERGDYPVIELGEDIDVVAGNEIFVKPKVSGGLAPYKYQWSNDIKWDMRRTLKRGETMHLKVKVTDRRGCISSDAIRIAVK